MFRCWIEILVYGLALSAGAEAHPLLSTNGTETNASSSIVPRTIDLELTLSSNVARNLAGKLLFKLKIGRVKTTRHIRLLVKPQRRFTCPDTYPGMYEVTLPWPCRACKSKSPEPFPALAKKHIDQSIDMIQHEREGLQKAGQLLDYGTDSKDRSQWTIVRDMRVIEGSTDRRHTIMDIIEMLHKPPHGRMTTSQCEEILQTAHAAAVRRMEEYAKQGVIVKHANLGSVLFPPSPNRMPDNPVFVNWASWQEIPLSAKLSVESQQLRTLQHWGVIRGFSADFDKTGRSFCESYYNHP